MKTVASRAPLLPATLRRGAPAAALVGLVLLAYLPVAWCGFVWDDDAYVTDNQALHAPGGLARIWTEPRALPQYYPLVFTSFWLEYGLWGLDPAGYHATNAGLHALAAVLAWRVLLALRLPAAAAWLSAAVFAVHPVHVESVAWISERKNVLSAVFYLAALLAYLRFDRASTGAGSAEPSSVVGGAGGTRRSFMLWYLAALALFAAALLSKSVTATLPAAILLVIWWQRGRIGPRDVLPLVPWFALGIASGLFTWWLERTHVGASGAEWSSPPTARLLVAGRALWFYAAKLVWPANLTFIYPRWDVDPHRVMPYAFPLGAVVLLVGLWVARRRLGRGPLAAALFFAGTLLPALGLIDVYPHRFSFVADHFQYLASLGLITVLCAWGCHVVAGWRERRRAAAVATAAAMLVVLAGLTWQRTRSFRDAETLWRDTVAKNPAAWMAHNHLGVIALARGDLQNAEFRFRRVLEIRPRDVRARANLASLAVRRGNLAGAIDDLQAALAIEPDFVAARLNLCQVLFAEGRAGEAAEHYLHALAVDPQVARVQEQLALLLLSRADRATGSRFYERATAIVPDWTMLTNEQAWLLATRPGRSADAAAEALRLAHRAAELCRRRDANVLDTLAAAQAATGQYVEAVATAESALALIADPASPLAAEIRDRLGLYRAGRPYVVPETQAKP